MTGCDHKFIDSTTCAKCGFDPGRSCDLFGAGAPRLELSLETRVSNLESVHTQRLDMHAVELRKFGTRIERLEMPVDSRDAIVWDMGHDAAKAGTERHENPFRKRVRAPWPSR